MLKNLIAFSLKNQSLVLMLAGLLILFAGWRLGEMPVDVFPELNAPTVVILTESGGLTADEVEQYVTFPIESGVGGLPGVRRVRSASAISLSLVWVEFDWGEDIYRARQLVSEKLSSIRENLPEQAHAEIAPVTSITGEIMLLSLTSPDESVSPLDLRAIAEFDLRNRIMAVPGIAQVTALGGELPEYQVLVKQDELRSYGLTMQDVVDAAKEAHSTESGGFIVNYEGLELPIRQQAAVRSAEDIASTIIHYHEGRPVTLGDVAEVKLDGALKRGTGADRGKPAVVLSVQKSPGTNTINLTAAVDEALEAFVPSLPKGAVLNSHVMRQTDFINRSVDNLLAVLRDATIFVALVLILFLMNARTTFITLTALPLSLGVALLVLWALGMTINVMTLGGLAVAIGELVDDAIIDVENVFRRLRENRALPEAERRATLTVVFDASNEIRSSVVFATVIIVLVFVPLLFLQGLEGRFFRPLGISYIVALLASLFVALTVTPVLCRILLGGAKRLGVKEGEGFFIRWIKRAYEPALNLALRKRKTVVFGALLATGLSLAFASTFGTSFLPKFNEGTFTVFLMAPPGTSLNASDRLARGVEERLGEIEGVQNIVRRTGRAERDEHAEPVSSSEIEVTVKEGFEKNDIYKEIDSILKQIPGITTMIGQPIEHRLSHVMSGTKADVAINIFGDDLSMLRKLAKEVEAELKQVPGAASVNASREIMISTLPVEYDRAALARWGLTPAMAADQVMAAVYGAHITDVNEGVRRYGMVVRLAEEERESPDDLKHLLLRGKGGAHVELDDVARIGIERASNLIARENVQRKAVVSLNVGEGANLGHLVAEVRSRVDPIVEKSGYSVHYGGQFEAQQSATKMILITGAVVLVIILMLLTSSFGSMKAAILVLVNLPLALIGGIVAIYLTASEDLVGNTLALFGLGDKNYVSPIVSISSLVGFVSLFGIAIRNGILLVNHYQYLMQEEKATLREAIIRGSHERLVPILMTALTAILGMVPLAMAAGEPGSELLAPLAIVVLGGLVTSTFLNLIVVPAGYQWMFDKEDNAAAEPAAATEESNES